MFPTPMSDDAKDKGDRPKDEGPNPPPRPEWEDYWAHRVADEAKKKVIRYFGIATILVSIVITLYGLEGINKVLETRYTKLIDQKEKAASKKIRRDLQKFEKMIAAHQKDIKTRKTQFMKATALAQDYRGDGPSRTFADAIDLSNTIGDIRDAGADGAATVGISIAYAMQSSIARTKDAKVVLSARGIYELAKKHDEWDGENYEGTSLLGGLKAVTKTGAFLENDWPYSETEQPPKIQPAYKLDSFSKVAGVEGIKQALRGEMVVVVTVMVSDDWSEPGKDGELTIRLPLKDPGGHTICVVGYDDKKATFKIANMWGKKWGVEGFARIRDADLAQIMEDAYTLSVR